MESSAIGIGELSAASGVGSLDQGQGGLLGERPRGMASRPRQTNNHSALLSAENHRARLLSFGGNAVG